MTHTTKHTPLDKATRAIPMLYAEAFAGSNNKEFVVELYEDARLLEKAAPAMYEALRALVEVFPSVVKMTPYGVPMSISKIHDNAVAALAQAEARS